METTETMVTKSSGKPRLGGRDPNFFKKRWARLRRMRRQGPWVPDDVGSYQDRIARAVRREREHRQVGTLESDSVIGHVFQCVCCGRVCGDEERREPSSEVCMRCVGDAGFWN